MIADPPFTLLLLFIFQIFSPFIFSLQRPLRVLFVFVFSVLISSCYLSSFSSFMAQLAGIRDEVDWLADMIPLDHHTTFMIVGEFRIIHRLAFDLLSFEAQGK